MYFDAFTISLLMISSAIAIVVLIGYILLPRITDDLEKREKLLLAVKSLRLSEMLHLLNIPLEQYVITLPVQEIRKHVKACRACAQISSCDRCFRRGIPDDDMSFCPNHKSLIKHGKRLKVF